MRIFPAWVMSQVLQRIVCLSAEAADWLWRIRAWKSIAGVSPIPPTPSPATPHPYNQIEENAKRFSKTDAAFYFEIAKTNGASIASKPNKIFGWHLLPLELRKKMAYLSARKIKSLAGSSDRTGWKWP
jgi:hypothetical protein